MLKTHRLYGIFIIYINSTTLPYVHGERLESIIPLLWPKSTAPGIEEIILYCYYVSTTSLRKSTSLRKYVKYDIFLLENHLYDCHSTKSQYLTNEICLRKIATMLRQMFKVSFGFICRDCEAL